MQAPLREDVAQQHAGVGAAGTPLHGAHRLRRGDIQQALAHVIARQREGIVGGLGGWRLRGGNRRRQVLKDVVEQPLVEGEVLADRLGRHVRRNLGRDADRALLVLQVDGEGELL